MPRTPLAVRAYNAIPPSFRAAPFEACCGLLFVLAGIPLLLGQRRANADALVRTMDPILLRAWGIVLFASGVLILLGLSMAARAAVMTYVLRGRVIERIGLLMLAWSLLIYALALAVVGGWRSALTVVLLIAFAAACTIRIVVIAGARALFGEAADALDNDRARNGIW